MLRRRPALQAGLAVERRRNARPTKPRTALRFGVASTCWCRFAAPTKQNQPLRSPWLRVSVARFVRNGRHLPWTERVKEGARLLEIELRIPCLDAEKEAIAAGQREPRHVEDRVIRHRQAVQGQHAEHRRQGGDEDGALEDDWDERRPTEQRPAADVPGILDG